MDKKIMGLLGGAISALALLGPARAETSAPPPMSQSLAANSFEELLQPTPNAVSILRALDEADANGQGQLVGGELTLIKHHHHHHHHHFYHHHHHHHHHHFFFFPHHHHHHHHHHHYLAL